MKANVSGVMKHGVPGDLTAYPTASSRTELTPLARSEMPRACDDLAGLLHHAVGELGVALAERHVQICVELGGDVVGGEAGLEGRARPLDDGDAGDVAAADREDASGLRARLGGEVADQRRDVLGLERLEQLRRHDVLGHARRGDRGDHVGGDPVLGALDGQRAGQADEAELGRRVVGLAEVAVEAGARRRVDDAAVVLPRACAARRPW
jgi:hypothetical protein